MSRTNHNPVPGDCPSLIDLAAYADRRLNDDEQTRLEVHVAGCESCMDILRELAVEAPIIDSESRMLIVPREALEAAMNLRSGDVELTLSIHVHRTASRWIVGMRRGLAAAAAIGIMLGGYQIGQSFTASASPVVNASNGLVVADDSAFGFLATTSTDDGNDLFAMALAGATADAGEVTP